MSFTKFLFLFAAIFIFVPSVVKADVSLLVLEAIGTAGEYTGSGHTAIYFSNICSDGHTNLRLCRPGENGTVISNYPSFGDVDKAEWMAMPLTAYLYGVETEDEIPLYANGKIRNFLRESYRRENLAKMIPGNEDGTMPKGGWKMMLTAAFNRDVYSFNLLTTQDEDAKFLQEFNKRTEKREFNTFSNNCADFAKLNINRYFPGSMRTDVINDFGITTPKAVARSLSGYARSHPDRLFNITKYQQVSGTIWRSFDNRNFTEMAFKSKKYIIPSLIFKPELLPIFAGTYFLTGRYNLNKTYKEYATRDIAKLKLEKRELKLSGAKNSSKSATKKEIDGKVRSARAALYGTKEQWSEYRAKFAWIMQISMMRGLFKDQKELETFYKDLETLSEPAFDGDGSSMLNVDYYGENRTLGITRENILNEYSDRELALKLMIAKISDDLNTDEKNRSSFPEFQDNWRILSQLISYGTISSTSTIDKNRGRFQPNPPKTSSKRKLELLLWGITH